MENFYKTILQESEGVYKEKGSKFLAFAYPVKSEDDVKLKIEFLKKEHHSARHHCWAYKLGTQGERYRCSDDGEPSNSAGKPILGQLESFGVTNVVVIVVRYFGGILLGVGGLMQAYKEAAKISLMQAEIVEKTIQVDFEIMFKYEQNNAVMKIIKRYRCDVMSQNYSETCAIHCSVAQNVANDCFDLLQQIADIKIIK